MSARARRSSPTAPRKSAASDDPRALTPTHHTGEVEILAQRGSQWSARAMLPTPTPAPAPTTPSTGKAPTVRLRLHGTPDEIAATLPALAEVLDFRTVSRPYPDRPPSTLHRVYIGATPRLIAKESK